MVVFYVEMWYTSTHKISAPFNDLDLLQNFIRYGKINKKVSEVAKAKLSAYLSCLSKELVGMSLFDSALPPKE